ncbi:MAG TPA: hypothetical protein VMV19_05640 [Xanthobacteraceae bacterium]|nr:hypothetical protein [Xanthobacteraceae bacterium]
MPPTTDHPLSLKFEIVKRTPAFGPATKAPFAIPNRKLELPSAFGPVSVATNVSLYAFAAELCMRGPAPNDALSTD